MESFPTRSPKYKAGDPSRKYKRESEKDLADAATLPSEGLKNYYAAKIDEHQFVVTEKLQNLRRLEAQRNELNAKGKRICS